MRRSLILASIGIAVACGSSTADVLFIDFGRTDLQSDPLRFNNFVPGVTNIANAIDENGNSTGMSIGITDPFFEAGEASAMGSEAPAGAAAQFGVPATDDYYFGHTTPFAGAGPNPLGVIEFGNLDANGIYTFTIFASRTDVQDIRDAQYDLLGGNAASGVLDASNNDSNVLVLSGLTASGAGVITLSVSPGPNNDNANGFFYLGAIRVDVVPSPGTMAVLAAGGLFMNRRRRHHA